MNTRIKETECPTCQYRFLNVSFRHDCPKCGSLLTRTSPQITIAARHAIERLQNLQCPADCECDLPDEKCAMVEAVEVIKCLTR